MLIDKLSFRKLKKQIYYGIHIKLFKLKMNTWGNGGFKPVPGGNIFNPYVPNGTYGAQLPIFGSVGNSNTTPQLTAPTITKGNGFVRVNYNDDFGGYAVFNPLGQKVGGTR